MQRVTRSCPEREHTNPCLPWCTLVFMCFPRVGLFCALSVLWVPLVARAQTAGPRDDYSGMYTFLKEGEFMQITIEGKGNVTGFISRFGDSESDQGTFIDQFFKSGKIDGNKISFSTEAVHGVSYAFEGTFLRGSGKSPQEEGYYSLQGLLTRNGTDAQKKTSSRSTKVEFQSFPRDAASPQ